MCCEYTYVNERHLKDFSFTHASAQSSSEFIEISDNPLDWMNSGSGKLSKLMAYRRNLVATISQPYRKDKYIYRYIHIYSYLQIRIVS